MRGTVRAAGLAMAVILALVLPGVAPVPVDRSLEVGATLHTECDREAAREGLQPIRSLRLPVTGPGWFTTPVRYGFAASRVPALDRVGYCLELGIGNDRRWVWAAHTATGEASDTGLPTEPGQVTRRTADALTVRSNVASVPEVTDGSGWLEMWPYAALPEASREVPGSYHAAAFSGDAHHDADDNPWSGLYGSFQVHAIGQDSATTVLAVNHWATPDSVLDVGIGPRPHGEPDWTAAGNAGAFTTRRLTFFGRPAGTVLDRAPESWQLVPRESRSATVASTTISGQVIDPRVTGITVVSRHGGRTDRRVASIHDGRFAVTVPVPVGLVATDIEVWEERADGRRLVHTATDVVAGDVYVVQGQSNAVAKQWGGSAHRADHPFLRTYGSSNPDPGISAGERRWSRGHADTWFNQGSVGQWAAEFAVRTIERTGVPVAVVNGAHGGRRVAFFSRDDADPDDPATNYGRLLLRLRAAGVADRIAGIFWLQGEADANDAAVHVAGVTRLVADWRHDLAGPDGEPAVFLMQVRRTPCRSATTTELRDAQRRLADRVGATLITLNGLTAPIGCHWDFTGGYRELGDWAADITAVVLDDADGTGVLAIDVVGARVRDRRTVVLGLAHAGPLTVPAGAAAGFRVAGGSIGVTSVRQVGATLVLRTDRPMPAHPVVEYVGFPGAGPWVRNRIGMGLPTFRVVATSAETPLRPDH